jgi:hypothetical protein
MNSLSRSLTFLLGLALVLFAGIARSSAATPDSEQITKLLDEARSHALQAEDDAATLESYTRSRVNWKLHAYELDSMKQHVNELGKIASQMQELEPQGSTWQKQTTRQVMPLLREMAANLTNTMQHLNENQSRVHMQPYLEYTRTNYELAKRTADLIRDVVDYSEAKSTAESLEEKLELAQK